MTNFMFMRVFFAAFLAFSLGGTAIGAHAAEPLPIPPHGVIGVNQAQMTAKFWLARLQQPDHVIMDRKAIAAYNARVTRLDPYVYDLQKLPAKVDRQTLTKWIKSLSTLPDHPLYDVHGEPVSRSQRDGFVKDLALNSIPAQQTVRYGLVTHRAALRAFPTMLRVFNHAGSINIDQFQESAIVPGTPVAILHQSRDGKWLFVEAPRYRAWMKARYVAVGTAKQVFDYVDKAPYLVVTGQSVRTVFTPEQPAVSQLQLDMGTRVPFDPDWPADKPVNGEGPFASHVIELPIRGPDGALAFTHALLQKTTDTRDHYLPLTRANIIRQGFKMLGQRYGWGGAFDAHDCSGFVSDVYRSMGVLMPRNTSAQSVSPAANKTLFNKSSTHAERMHAIQNLEVGDLIYIPGHVMMMIGRWHGQPYVINDVAGASFLGPHGKMHNIKLWQVAVMPLLPMMFNNHQTFVDRMTSIVRIRPKAAG